MGPEVREKEITMELAKNAKIERIFERRSVVEIPMPKEKKGFEFEGEYVGIKKKPYNRVSKTGEIEEKNYVQLIISKEGVRHAVACDGGLQEQLVMADVKPGDYVKCVNLGKKPLSNGQSINMWDVFVAQNERLL